MRLQKASSVQVVMAIILKIDYIWKDFFVGYFVFYEGLYELDLVL